MTALSATLPEDNECQSWMCRREGGDFENGDIGTCIGYHCARCGEPSGMYGHYSGTPASFKCGGAANVEG